MRSHYQLRVLSFVLAALAVVLPLEKRAMIMGLTSSRLDAS
jgi:hypothetical protein